MADVATTASVADGPLIRLSGHAEPIRVAPGGQASVGVTVYNPSAIVERIRLEMLGAARNWATLLPSEVNLFPKSTAQVTLTFHPSADAPPEAGAVPFAVKAIPEHQPHNSQTEESTVSVAAVPRIAEPELMPANSVAYRRGRHQLLVQNTGNAAIPVAMSGSDPDGCLRFGLRPSGFLLGCKETRLVRVRARAPRLLLTSAGRQHRFALTLSGAGIPDVKIPATFTQRPLIGRRLLAALAAVVTLAVLGYFLSRPVLKSSAQASNPPTPSRALQGAMAGPPGRPGSAGIPGARGPAGRTGVAGPAGPVGPKGGAGIPGARGTTGLTGATGAQGHAGTTGQAGARGLTGAAGLAGARGLTGAAGQTGPAGVNGPTGPQGPRGGVGLAGPQGPQGTTGPPGPGGVTNGYQQALTAGSITFSNPTAIVKTPQLPAGNYVVLASFTVSGLGGYGGSADCWTTPDSAGLANTDHIRAESMLTQGQALSINDIWTVTKASDSIDLVCEAPGTTATASNATITVFPLTNVTQTTVSGPTSALVR